MPILVYHLSESEAHQVLHWVHGLNCEGNADLEDLELAERIAQRAEIELGKELRRDLERMRNTPPPVPSVKGELHPAFEIQGTEASKLGNQSPTIQDIAHAISLQYRYEGWFQSVGVAVSKHYDGNKDCGWNMPGPAAKGGKCSCSRGEIVIYLIKKPLNYEKWQEHLRILCNPFPVSFVIIGKVRPA